MVTKVQADGPSRWFKYWYHNQFVIPTLLFKQWRVQALLQNVLLLTKTKLWCVTNFIQLVSSHPVNWFSQTKLHWKAPNEGYLHICGIYKRNNKQPRYKVISNYKSFVCWYLMNSWMDSHNQTCIGKCSSNCFQWYMVYLIVISIDRDTSI